MTKVFSLRALSALGAAVFVGQVAVVASVYATADTKAQVLGKGYFETDETRHLKGQTPVTFVTSVGTDKVEVFTGVLQVTADAKAKYGRKVKVVGLGKSAGAVDLSPIEARLDKLEAAQSDDPDGSGGGDGGAAAPPQTS